MLFNSIDFIIFFPIVTLIYFVIPVRVRYVWLLIISYYFYMSWNPKYALLIAFSTIATYICSLLMEKFNDNYKLKKLFLISNLIVNIGILVVFKYGNFILNNFYAFLRQLGINVIERKLDLLLPVGISFYTFQALSYTFDVYKGEIKAEENLLKYALFVSFFPQLVAGPIERSTNLLPQIQNIENIKVWNYNRVKKGTLLILWGLFQKMVIADRAAIVVNKVINGYSTYGFIEIFIALFLFSFQVYCDFNGYSIIAKGAAKIIGFELVDNFKQPYFAKSIKEFWHRWHISLTTWFTDYIYIPLGGNRQGVIRKYFNIFIVFGISGFWHGASWNYFIWGMIHAIYQTFGDLKNIAKEYIFSKSNKMSSFSKKIRQCALTFMLVDFAWIFFVCNSFKHSVKLLIQMFTCFAGTNSRNLGLNYGNWIILILSLIVLLIVDIFHENNFSIFDLLNKQEIWFRWLIYFILLWSTILFGIYGASYDPSTFIYFQF